MKCKTFVFATSLLLVTVSSASAAEPKRQGMALDAIRVGGVIGERIALTVTNNLMKLDYDKDFIPGVSRFFISARQPPPSIASCGAVDDELFSGDQVHATIRKGGTEK